MEFRIINPEPIPENQFVPHHVDVWYDRHERMWIIELKDIYENSLDPIERRYSKVDALKVKESFEKEFNLSVSN
jgi:hypothetical protein